MRKYNLLNRRVLRTAVMLIILAGLLGLDHPALAEPVNPITAGPAAPAARGRMTVDINSIDYSVTYKGIDGMLVHVYLEAGDLRGVPVRVGLFFFWEDDTPMEAGSEAIEGYVTENGNLTWQDVVTPKYRESEWKDIPVFIPYAFFPSVTEEANGFVVAEAGIEGQPFTRYGGRNYFTLNP